MELPPLNKHAQSLARLGALFLFFTTFIVGVVGFSLRNTHEEVKLLRQFLLNAEEVQPNFESSLQIYTENTENAILFVEELRPSDELDYIEFISQVEAVGQSVGININLSSDAAASGVDATGSNSLVYKVSFYGSYDQLMSFMKEIEELSYYVRVDAFDYSALSALEDSEREVPNVSLNLRLYVE